MTESNTNRRSKIRMCSDYPAPLGLGCANCGCWGDLHPGAGVIAGGGRNCTCQNFLSVAEAMSTDSATEPDGHIEIDYGPLINGMSPPDAGCRFRRRWFNKYICRRCGYPVGWHHEPEEAP